MQELPFPQRCWCSPSITSCPGVDISTRSPQPQPCPWSPRRCGLWLRFGCWDRAACAALLWLAGWEQGTQTPPKASHNALDCCQLWVLGGLWSISQPGWVPMEYSAALGEVRPWSAKGVPATTLWLRSQPGKRCRQKPRQEKRRSRLWG